MREIRTVKEVFQDRLKRVESEQKRISGMSYSEITSCRYDLIGYCLFLISEEELCEGIIQDN